MNLLDVFTKQGGIKLIERYLHNGVLLTAVSELAILGKDKKALEILRLAVEYKTKKKIEKKYKNRLNEVEKSYDPNIKREQSKKVWICWFQGIENAPAIVRKCVDSVIHNLCDREVIIITEKNYKNYVEFPQYIVEKWRAGNITDTHMTDLMRLELLLKYGGTWIDATVLCTSPSEQIPAYFFDSDLFMYQALKPGRDGESMFISSWYMSACSNNKILWITRELLYSYWLKNNCLADYFLLHIFMCMVLEHQEEEWKKIVPRDNATPHILLLNLFETYDEQMYKSTIQQTPFHKLSYKFTDEQKTKMGTYYSYIMSHDS